MAPSTKADTQSPLLPRAGWYDDPEAADEKRYWDGAHWTDERVPAPPIEPPVPPVPPVPPQTQQSPAPGWYDESGAAGEKRYWDGAHWTDQFVPAPPIEPPLPPHLRQSPAPGWYDDPEAADEKRYWDGVQWTDQRRLAPPSAPPVEPTETSPAAPPEQAPPEREAPTATVAEEQEAVTPEAGEPEAIAPGLGAPERIAPSPWYRRRATWAVAGVAVVAVAILAFLIGGGSPQGDTPDPGTFSGSGDNGFAIDFTVTPDREISDLQYDASNDAITMQGSVDETLPVEGGTFEVNLRDGLGLFTLTIEGRFTEGGTAATGTYTLGLAPGVEQQSGGDATSSGDWSAAIDD